MAGCRACRNCSTSSCAARARCSASSARRRPPLSTLALAVVAIALMAVALPQTAAASFSGSAGKVAWIHDGVLQVDDPFDELGPRTITTVPAA